MFSDKELECCIQLIDGLNALEKLFISEKEKLYLGNNFFNQLFFFIISCILLLNKIYYS